MQCNMRIILLLFFCLYTREKKSIIQYTHENIVRERIKRRNSRSRVLIICNAYNTGIYSMRISCVLCISQCSGGDGGSSSGSKRELPRERVFCLMKPNAQPSIVDAAAAGTIEREREKERERERKNRWKRGAAGLMCFYKAKDWQERVNLFTMGRERGTSCPMCVCV